MGIVAGAQLLTLKEVVAFVSARWNALHRVLWRLADVAVLVILRRSFDKLEQQINSWVDKAKLAA